MVVQALLVVSALLGLSSTSADALDAHRRAIDATFSGLTPFGRSLVEFWYNARPMLLEVGVPALLMGCSFPLANALIQRAERAVGSRAGTLYLANTAGAVCGSLATGFCCCRCSACREARRCWRSLPRWRSRRSTSPRAKTEASGPRPRCTTSVPVLIVAVAVVLWLRLPPDYVLNRSLVRPPAGERLLTLREGITEVIGVTEVPGRGRGLMTNGHPMSSTALLDQRYMRALAHIPLLSMPAPTRVLVIGFGVGNSTQAATLHPSVERVDVADLSRDILDHAGYFSDANKDVLKDPRVSVYVNDGRQHLAMQPTAAYDLITLEPPPIAHAGVAALYSREFYALARSRLKEGGYLSQWLPAYEVPAATSLAMVRAFIDVFPQSVLLSGTDAELLLVGTSGGRIEIDPVRVSRALEQEPGVAADLRRLDLGSVTEIVGTFVGSADTLARATSQSTAVSDDRPLQEYGVRSAIDSGTSGVLASIFDLAAAATWCPRCFDGESPTPLAGGLDMYLALLDHAYHATGRGGSVRGAYGDRRVLGSAYLGAVVPDTDAVHNIIGVALLRQGRYDAAAAEFREALTRRADSADANRNLGTALAESGHVTESIGYLRRAVQLAPGNGGAQYRARNPAPRAAPIRGGGGLFSRGSQRHAGFRGGPQRPRHRARVARRPESGHRALQAGSGARAVVRGSSPEPRVRAEGPAAIASASVERLGDGAAECRGFRRDLARKERDDLAVLADHVLAEVPRRQVARCAEKLVNRGLVRSRLRHELRKHRERHVVGELAELRDFLSGAWLLRRRSRCSGIRAPRTPSAQVRGSASRVLRTAA